ncbi:MAG: hypothetical protein HY909_06890 [Deltaproteobacteria bacterium]|nr:hypothetical protein [Deltaproteobacteria bacterium]
MGSLNTHRRLRGLALGLGCGVVAAGSQAWVWSLGPLHGLAWALFWPTLAVCLGASVVLGLVTLRVRAWWLPGAALALGLQLLSVPGVGWLTREAILDAQRYCEALAMEDQRRPTGDGLEVPRRDLGGGLPALARPGFSRRYGFLLTRAGGSYGCRFPDPLGVRTAWLGERVGGRWTWEKLMD